jgi:hypothetical protein
MSQDVGESQNQTLPLQKLLIVERLILTIVVPQHLLKHASIPPPLQQQGAILRSTYHRK